MTTIAVIGLGYVGLPVAVAFARRFAGVIGFDANPQRIAELVAARGLAPAALDIRFGIDPIGAMAAFGKARIAWPEMAKEFVIRVRDLAARGFKGPFAVADGRVVHDAGGSEAQELAYMLAVSLAYVRALEAEGVPLDAARRIVSFRVAADAEQFLTIAKIRALRVLWARVEAACGLAPAHAVVSAETAWRMMTRRDPYVNILRTTVAVFAALADKDIEGVVVPLLPHIGEWHVGPITDAGPRGLGVEVLEARVRAGGAAQVQAHGTLEAAFAAARTAAHARSDAARVLVFGSFHTVTGVLPASPGVEAL